MNTMVGRTSHAALLHSCLNIIILTVTLRVPPLLKFVIFQTRQLSLSVKLSILVHLQT